DFDVVQISPDPAVDSVWVAAVSASTSRVWVRIANRGVKNTNAALPVAIYNTDTPGTAFLQTKQVGAIIAPGGMYDIYFDIPSATMNIIMSVRLQDTGTQYPAPGSFLDCNYANNTGTVSGLLAVQDYYLLPSGRPSRFDVRDNDFLSSCGRGHLSKFDTIPGGGLRHGSLTIGADSVFTYTPANNFLGVDSVTYYIKCLTDSSSAKAYLLIQRPRSLQYVACQNASVVMGFDAATGVQYYWFNAATGGSVVSGGSNANTLTVTKTADPVQTWWVEARYGSIIFPRYRVDLELSDNCGTIDPVGCAAEGTVLYRGDFGGNNVSDPLFSATPLPAGTTTYGFVSSATPADGQYTLLKNSPGSANAWFAYEDHTLPESNRGYFMLINADYTPALFYTTTIRGLCENTELYFSAWAGDLMMPSYGASIRPKLRFVLQDAATLETLASYTTSEMPLVSPATWRLYGFGFTNHSDSLKLSIYNDAPGGNGNDLVLDDIEIRFCAPRVELQPAPFRTDTVVRAGTSFAFEGAYTDDGTFGASLVYRWEHNLTGNMNDPTGWAVVPGTEGSATGGTVHSVYNISSVTRSDSGYYRLAVADAAHINAYNCRAMSDIVRLRVLDGIRSDSVTIQEFQAMEIDILANDALPASLFTSSFNLLNAVIQQPHAGVLSAAGGGTGADSRLYYVNQEGADGLTGNIDSFRYEFTFYDVDVAATVTVNATVYIYVLQNRGGFSVCRGEPFTVRLAEKPAGVYFEWFTDALPSLPLGSGAVRTLATVNGDSAFLVRPVTPIGAFPVGQLTVRSVDPSATGGLRWTGTANSRWYYPGNWVELRHEGGFSFESPALWTPVRCVDVTLPSGMVYYPELVDTARCRCISVKDRALLVNPHVLVYDSARVEINLLPTERDRFVMWSAPLKDMYSGDYHFKGAGGQPYWGDTYMNFFQRGNPEGGASQANTFTATFGLPNVSLELGTAFNLKLTSTTRTKGAAWVFPQPDTYYTDAAAQRYPASGNLRRIESHRFVTDGVWLNPDRFQMNIFDSPGYDLVQVVNPYLAWLDVSKFLAGNSDRLSPAGYLIWSGHVDENFSAVSTAGNRLVYTHPPLSLSPGLIPPLQSFFVQKITPAATYAGVYMSPKWTTTSAPQHSYVLRAEAQENGVLRIRATQSGRTAYALLHYLPQAVPEYRSNEDIRTLFYNELPLTVYTLGTQGEPLAINASGSFGLSETPLTVRVHSAGEVRLDFTGMESFGHDVYLIDREAGREIDLQETPYCTFVVTGASGGATEISNRFFLKMNYTGRGLLTDTEPEALLPDALFSGEKGHIRVRALSGHMRRIEIYNPLGMPVYVDNTVSEAYDIPVAHAGVYIVKVQLGERTVTRKVLVGDQ
ncbi:MAG: hypothetical protein LBP50_09840, partial [Tannerella sp.]|nr:hypothetical protein [Tannerella sp.]